MPSEDGKLSAIKSLRMMFLPSEDRRKKKKKRDNLGNLGNPKVNRDGTMKKEEEK